MGEKCTVRLSIRNLKKSFAMADKTIRTVVDDVSFDVEDNEFLVLLGPGQCGKSVMLNIMSGLLPADTGIVELDGQPVTKPNPHMGMVFQKLGLLPWKTVWQNVEIGPKMRGIKPEDRKENVQKCIDLVGLTGFEKHYPRQLSGGMKQRVGIARAYANDPQILVMDEPFGQLDAQTRYNMQEEIQRIWSTQKRTIIFVTNNIEEALYLGDRIILLTACPAKIKAIYPINLPRPRDVLDPEFLRLRKEISDNTEFAM